VSGRAALGDYRWWNVRPGTAVTPPRLAHAARYEPPGEWAPLVARCGFTFAPEDTVKRPARPYSRCPHCEHLAAVARGRHPAEYVAAYSAGYRSALLVAWKAAHHVAEADS
jgi:hypothetical protein